MNAVPSPASDAMLEAAIAIVAARLREAKTDTEKRECWNELRSLHLQRSDEQIKRMERKQGLCAP